MPAARHFDTVVFDERDNARMLFFARTTSSGDIEDYLLITRVGDEFADLLMLEVNEQQVSGEDLISKATLTGNVLTLDFAAPIAQLDDDSSATITFDNTPGNRASIEAGVFAVIGDSLDGGHA
jgi:hypothetical protein